MSVIKGIVQLRRGLEKDRLQETPLDGELTYSTESRRLYIGDGITPGGTPIEFPEVYNYFETKFNLFETELEILNREIERLNIELSQLSFRLDVAYEDSRDRE